MIVKPDSGDPGLCRPMPIDADHYTICKPKDRTSEIYVHVRDFVERKTGRPIDPIAEKVDALAEGQHSTQAQLAALTAQIAREKGVETAPLRAVLAKIGEVDLRDEDILVRLEKAADELVSLRSESQILRQEDSDIDHIRQEMLSLVDRGDFDAAQIVLNKARLSFRSQQEDTARSEAALLGDEARIESLQFNYRVAASRLGEAASIVAAFNSDAEWKFLLRKAKALCAQGDEFGDNSALEEAIAVYRSCLDRAPRAERPLDWAQAQEGLGHALTVLGDRHASTAALEEAVTAYRGALQEFTSGLRPKDAVNAQIGLGAALYALGSREVNRETGRRRFEEALSALRQASKEGTNDQDQLALAQNNLAIVLTSLVEPENGTVQLEEAIATYQEALNETPRERSPLTWGALQHNLGIALSDIGRFEEAVAACHEALSVRRRDRVPIEWARTMHNLGHLFTKLGKETEAIAAYTDALKEFTRDRVPVEWARTQRKLAGLLRDLGKQENRTGPVEEAIALFSGALEQQKRETDPNEWAAIHEGLGDAFETLANLEYNEVRRDQAVDSYREALKECSVHRFPLAWARIQYKLGMIFSTSGRYHLLGAGAKRLLRLEQAVEAFNQALKGCTRELSPPDWANIQYQLGKVLRAPRPQSLNWPLLLEQAIGAFREAKTELTREREPIDWARITLDESAAMIDLALLSSDLRMAETAVEQISNALETIRGLGDPIKARYFDSVEHYESRLREARGFRDQLKSRKH